MESFRKVAQELLDEIIGMLSTADNTVYMSVVNGLLSAKHVVVAGDGRSKFVAAAFVRKLSQLGRGAALHGDASSRAAGRGDLLIVLSCKGSRGSLTTLADGARRRGARVCAITGESSSILASVADAVVAISPQTKTPFDTVSGNSRTGTLAFDEAVMIYLDAVLMSVQEVLGLPPGEAEEE